MKNYKFGVLALVMAASLTSCYMPLVIDSPPTDADYQRAAELEQKVRYGPHYKNRNAAGRLIIFNRTKIDDPPRRSERLRGPAYKNRKPVSTTPDDTTTTQGRRSKLSGPRYKNRDAKTRRPE